MGIYWRWLQAAAIIVLFVPAVFLAIGFLGPETIVSQVQRRVAAPPARVWAIATDWRTITARGGAGSGLPVFLSRTVVGGGDPVAGKVLRYSLGPDQAWNQKLTEWEPDRRYAFRNAAAGHQAPLPGNVAMAFTFRPTATDSTEVGFTITVTSHGAINKALALVLGDGLGTLRGYQALILREIASASVRAGGPPAKAAVAAAR